MPPTCARWSPSATPRVGGPFPGGWWCEAMTGTSTEAASALDQRSPGVAARITPLALLGGRHASRVLERNILVYRRSWVFIRSGFFEPLFYLLSVGVGLSHLVGPINVDGHEIPYTAFVAPGLLASSAMNGAMLDSTFLVFFKLKIAKTYDAMLSTPLGVSDVALGELSWCVLRGTLYSGAFLAIMAILGWPAAVLISLAFASAGMAGTTYMRTWQDFDMVSLAFIPLFLFSATFYPLTVYPGWLQAIVRVTPLYQGVVLCRAADLGIWAWTLLLHIAYLVAMAVVGVVIPRRRLGALLLP